MDDLRHYVTCHRLWTLRYGKMSQNVPNVMIDHAGLQGDAPGRRARMSAWVAALRAYCTIRHSPVTSVADAIGAGVDQVAHRLPRAPRHARLA